MVARTNLLILTFLLLLAASPAAAAPAAVHVVDLVEHATTLDGQTVTVEGEVIGDVMLRGETGWINISDPTGDVGIWAESAALQQITHVGRYDQAGDRVRITGQFRRADPALGGEPSLRADSVEMLQAGGPTEHPIPPGLPAVVAASLTLAAGLGLLRWRAVRSRR